MRDNVFPFSTAKRTKDGMMFPIMDDQELGAATKEMLRTAYNLNIIAEEK